MPSELPLPTPIRGRITVVSRQITKTLMFNPEEVTDNKGVDYGWNTPVGASHPVAQYGAGGQRNITFELTIDGDRGQLARGKATLDVSREIAFYRSLLYANQYGNVSFSQVNPSLVIFSMGTVYSGVTCVVTKADVKILAWTPQMAPTRATISLTLTEVVKQSQTAGDVFQPSNQDE